MKTFVANKELPSFCIIGAVYDEASIQSFLEKKDIHTKDDFLYEVDLVLHKELKPPYVYFINYYKDELYVGVKVESLSEEDSLRVTKEDIYGYLTKSGFPEKEIVWIYKGQW